MASFIEVTFEGSSISINTNEIAHFEEMGEKTLIKLNSSPLDDPLIVDDKYLDVKKAIGVITC